MPTELTGLSYTSKYKGVYWCEKDKSWIAGCIRGRGRRKRKCYKTEVEAAIGYNELVIELQGELGYTHPNTLTKEDQVIYDNIQTFNESVKGKLECDKCREYLLPDEFHNAPKNKQRECRANTCKKCVSKKNKEYHKNRKECITQKKNLETM